MELSTLAFEFQYEWFGKFRFVKQHDMTPHFCHFTLKDKTAFEIPFISFMINHDAYIKYGYEYNNDILKEIITLDDKTFFTFETRVKEERYTQFVNDLSVFFGILRQESIFLPNKDKASVWRKIMKTIEKNGLTFNGHEGSISNNSGSKVFFAFGETGYGILLNALDKPLSTESLKGNSYISSSHKKLADEIVNIIKKERVKLVLDEI